MARTYEQKLLRQYLDSSKPELVAVYGRRRVGETFLVKKTFNERFDFWFTGLFETSRIIQLRQFGKELSRYSGKNIPIPKDWFEAFDLLQVYLVSLDKKEVIVFLDEIPWLDTKKGSFLPAFSYFGTCGLQARRG